MNKIKVAVLRLAKMDISRATVINLLALIGLLFFFEPTSKQDDYNQVMILYGGFSGEFSPYTLYVNTIFSKTIHLLLNYFPNISWYYVLQYILVFLSLTTVVYVFLKRSIGKEWRIPAVLIMVFCGYELYIRFTFTTVAGIAILSGFLLLLYLIENEEGLCIRYLYGVALIFFGMLLRGRIYELIVAIFFSSFIIYILMNYKKDKKVLIKKALLFTLLVLTMFGVRKGLESLDSYEKSSNESWRIFNEANTKRSTLQDYGMPDYQENIDNYEKIGVTYNDYISWKNEGLYNDYDFFTLDRVVSIKNVETETEKDSFLTGLLKSSRNIVTYYLNDTGIYLLFIAVVCMAFYRSQKIVLYIVPISACCLFAYFYMSHFGRLKHHVDVCVMIAGAVLLLYYSLPADKQIDYRKCNTTIVALTLVYICFNYEGLTFSSYYGNHYGSGKSQKEEYDRNKDKLTLLSEDQEHYYLFGTNSTDFVYNREWTIFDVVTPGYYHNMISAGFFHQPDTDKMMKEYGVKNIYKEMTNSKLIYVVSVDEKISFIDTLCTYIQEHYNPEAYFTMVKKIDNLNIYRFTEGDVKISWNNNDLLDSSEVQSDISAVETEDGGYKIEGYAFVEGADSYAQNIYLSVTDNVTGETRYNYALQTQNDRLILEDKYHGRYSNFSGIVELPNSSGDVEMSVYIETEKGVYQMVL